MAPKAAAKRATLHPHGHDTRSTSTEAGSTRPLEGEDPQNVQTLGEDSETDATPQQVAGESSGTGKEAEDLEIRYRQL